MASSAVFIWEMAISRMKTSYVKELIEVKIVVARSAGFCFGVKRAVNMAFEAANVSDSICSLGPLIHSPQLWKSWKMRV